MSKPFSITVQGVERFQRALIGTSSPIQELGFGGCVSLAAASELDCILQQASSTSLRREVDEALSQCPLWSLFRNLRNGGGSGRLSISSISVVRIPVLYDERWQNFEMQQLEKMLLQARFSQHLAKSLTGAVFEMVDNVWNHSQTEADAILSYQAASRSFTFSVADLGLGVLETLRENKRYGHLKTSIEALEEAIKPNVSGKAGGSGLGLDTLTRAFADLWGQTRLRSGQGALTFDRETDSPKRKHQFLPQLKGFQISAICRLARPRT